MTWLLALVGIALPKPLHLGAAWVVALFLGGLAFLFLVAAYRLYPPAFPKVSAVPPPTR
jgi:hypothetical protein